MKYIGLGLLSPLALPALGLGALGRKLGLGKKVKDYKPNWFDPSALTRPIGLTRLSAR